MSLPVPSFKVLLYGPNLPAGGIKARAHFEEQVLVVQAKGHWFTIQGDRLGLEKGGFDGRQWLLGWKTSAGPVSALLQGKDAVEAFIKLAPPSIAKELKQQYRAFGGRLMSPLLEPRIIVVFLLLLLTIALLFWQIFD
jgi:hypothetical protein